MDITTERVRGCPVIDNQGANLGTLDDIAFDPQTWRVRGIVVSVHRDVAQALRLGPAGARKLELAPERVQAMGDNIILNLDASQLAGLLQQTTGTP